MSFFEYRQNNSGGSFYVDESVAHYVYVEAEDSQRADEIAQGIGIYFDGCNNNMDCNCCGDRWHEADEGGVPTDDILAYAAEALAPKWFNDEAVIHYASGRTARVK